MFAVKINNVIRSEKGVELVARTVKTFGDYDEANEYNRQCHYEGFDTYIMKYEE